MRRFVAVATVMLLASEASTAGPREEHYELQERCGKRAAEVFRSNYGTGINQEENGQSFASYTNHYNAKQNKCFMVVEATGPLPGKKTKEEVSTAIWLWLNDVNENKEYGKFMAIIELNKPPRYCEVVGKSCRNRVEWDELIKPYMEQ